MPRWQHRSAFADRWQGALKEGELKMAKKKSRDRLVEALANFIGGNASRADLAAAAIHYDQVTRVKLQPALRQLLDVMKQAGQTKSEN